MVVQAFQVLDYPERLQKLLVRLPACISMSGAAALHITLLSTFVMALPARMFCPCDC